MVGEEVDLFLCSCEAGDQACGLLDIFLVVVDPGHQWDADVDLRPALRQQLEVVEDALVGHPGPLLVPGRIDELEVIEKKVGRLGHLEQQLAWRKAGGIHRPVDAALPQGPQQGKQKLGLLQRFAAGDGHPALAVRKEDPLAIDHRQHLVNRHQSPRHLGGGGRADLGTGTAGGTAGKIGDDAGLGQGTGPLRAGLDAGPAADALGAVVHLLHLGRDAFRVMAPGAAQGAALEEDGNANTWPVVDRIFFDVEDTAFVHSPLSQLIDPARPAFEEGAGLCIRRPALPQIASFSVRSITSCWRSRFISLK